MLLPFPNLLLTGKLSVTLKLGGQKDVASFQQQLKPYLFSVPLSSPTHPLSLSIPFSIVPSPHTPPPPPFHPLCLTVNMWLAVLSLCNETLNHEWLTLTWNVGSWLPIQFEDFVLLLEGQDDNECLYL